MNENAIRDRIDLIAHERGLSESEAARAKTLTTSALLAFAARHSLSMDWLVTGDLQGRMRQARGLLSYRDI
jgi:hypothetical protein